MRSVDQMAILAHCQFPDLDGCTIVIEEGCPHFRKCILIYQEIFGTDSEIIQKKSI